MSARTDDVRVGIVSYNTAELLDHCLGALPSALDGARADVVVVDNASNDNSVAVVRAHENVRLISNPTNVGYARAMNQALAGSQAPVLLALNPDTLPAPRSLVRLLEALEARDEAGMVVPRLLNPDGTLQHSVHRFPSVPLALVMGLAPFRLRRGRIGQTWWLDGFAPHDEPAVIDWAVGAVHAIRRAALDDPEHAYSERWFMYVEDLDLCWRMRRREWGVLLEPDAEVVHVGNAAGAKQWGSSREARWLNATYEWYVAERGPTAARVWAGANCLGLAAKLSFARVQRDQEHATQLRQLLSLHSKKVVRPRAPLPSSGAAPSSSPAG